MGAIEQVSQLAFAIILDPKFKKLYFQVFMPAQMPKIKDMIMKNQQQCRVSKVIFKYLTTVASCVTSERFFKSRTGFNSAEKQTQAKGVNKICFCKV